MVETSTEQLNQMWYEEENTSEDVTVATFETLCDSMIKQKKIVDELKERLKDESGIMEKMKTKFMAHMTDQKKKKYQANSGTFSVTDKTSVKVPKSPEDRALFFGWLRDKGVFQSVITVNSQTLNSIYKQEFDAAEDPHFKIPGINAVTTYQTLNIRGK